MAIQKLPVSAALASRLNDLKPPTQAAPNQRVQPGSLELVACNILFVNTTVAIGGFAFTSGGQVVAPMSCVVYVNGTILLNVPWIGPTPTIGPAWLLQQPPLMFVIGIASPAKPIMTAGLTGPTPLFALTGLTVAIPLIDSASGTVAGVGGHYIVQQAGPYRVFVQWLANPTITGGWLTAGVYFNGVLNDTHMVTTNNPATHVAVQSKIIRANVGDEFQPVGQASGSITMQGDIVNSYWTVEMVSQG